MRNLMVDASRDSPACGGDGGDRSAVPMQRVYHADEESLGTAKGNTADDVQAAW